MAKLEVIEPRGILNAVFFKSDNAGCGFIRVILPSESLNSWRYNNLSFNFITSSIFINSPTLYKHMSFIKFQRSATADQLSIIEYCVSNIQKQTNTPIIYESDDNLFNIPKSNFAHDYYIKNKPNIEKMLSIVDGITVSTGFLKKEYSKYNKNISVVPNYLCKFLWGDVNKRESFDNVGDKPRIVYPGSQNHFASRDGVTGGDIGPELMNFIIKTRNKYDWIFIGGLPRELLPYVEHGEIKHVKWVNILDYPLYMKNLKADIAIAPLELNDFNRSKSNLKMLEYTTCGLPAIYTNIEPYRNAKYKADTEEYFIHLIEMMADNIVMREKAWYHDYNMVKSGLFLEDNRKIWINNHLKLFNKVIK